MKNPARAALVVAVAVVAVANLAVAGACSKPATESPKPSSSSVPSTSPVPAAAGGATTAAKAPTSLKEDKVQGGDGAIAGDGTNDGVISLAIDGPVSALALITCDASGNAADGQQWDTVVAGQAINKGWKVGFDDGGTTWQLGVFEGGRLLNASNGQLSPLAAGRHTLSLYASDSGYFNNGTSSFIVLAERPDHSVVRSNIFR